MNKFRRKAIRNIIKTLKEMLEHEREINVDVFEDIIDETQTILDDEETYFYNIPENLQSGSRYEESENAIDNLEDAINDLEYIDEESSQEEIRTCVSDAIKNLGNCI